MAQTLDAHADAKRARTEEVLREVEDLADLLDTRFSILGIRFGVDSLIGLIPGIGDAASLLVSLYVVALAVRAGASVSLVFFMLLNILIDAALGLVPGLGDVIDVFYRANARNAAMLRRELERRTA
ncbi:MAG: DUF4112 domain-containing protein [Pseudomonadota bacterium]